MNRLLENKTVYDGQENYGVCQERDAQDCPPAVLLPVQSYDA